MDTSRTEDPDSRHSWLVAVVGAVAMVFTFGTPVSYGIFRGPFSDAFGISPIALSVVFAIMLFTFFIGSGLVGVFGVRFPARGVLLVCAAVTGGIAPSLYVVESVIGLTVVFAVLGIALGTVVVLVASIVPRWFERRRGVATGLVLAGNGLGLFLLPPIWQFSLNEMGVRRGFLGIMAVTAITFFAAALVCRRPSWTEKSSASTRELFDWIKQLVATRSFRYLFVGVALAFGWYQLLAAYAVDLFVYRGLSVSAASTAFGLIGGISIISRLGGGYIGDILGPRRAFLGSIGCVAVGIVLLLVPTISGVGVAILLLGLGLGGTATIYIPLVMNLYPPEKDTAIIGVFNVGGGFSALAMPPLGTGIVMYTGSFTVAILLTLALTVVGIATVAVGTRDS